jgi:hypothetical protein
MARLGGRRTDREGLLHADLHACWLVSVRSVVVATGTETGRARLASLGMSTTRGAAASRRKEATTAAHRLLADKVAAVSSLAELGAEVDTAADRVTAAQQALSEAREAYAEQYRSARAAGWSVSDLTSAGCDQERAGGALRSRPRARGRADNGSSASTDVASPPSPGASDSGDTASDSSPSKASEPVTDTGGGAPQ